MHTCITIHHYVSLLVDIPTTHCGDWSFTVTWLCNSLLTSLHRSNTELGEFE